MEERGTHPPGDHGDEPVAMVRIGVLRKFEALVTQLGGDHRALLAREQLDPAILDNRHAMLPYRTFVHLLERAASDLNCPDFGMRLAQLQGKGALSGPLYVAMRHSPTLGEAFRYAERHSEAYTSGTQLFIEEDRAAQRVMIRFEILLARLPYQRQTLEHSLALMRQHVDTLTGGRVRLTEAWFAHQPLAPQAAYRAHMGCPVLFGRSMNCLVLTEADLRCEIDDADPWLFELATSFIEQRFPGTEPTLRLRVRALIERLLLEGDCQFMTVAGMLGMHPRTLQRRLRAEGESFETIKDAVRRDVALRYLCQSELPLTRIAELLGYSETSVLSRSCYRWFSASPRQLRRGKGADVAAA